MSAHIRRTLRVDDPVGGRVCHVAHPESDQEPTGRLRDIPLADIRPNRSQPRKRFDDDSLRALANSIRERGVLQPIIAQPQPSGGYELVAGERRWRASQLAGIPTIPALVVEPLDGATSLELALIENIARDDLTIIEEARTIAALLDELGVTMTTLARRLGRNRSDLTHTVRLLDLPDDALKLIDEGRLSKGHGKALLSEPDHSRRRDLAHRAAGNGWSVRALEAEIGRAVGPRSSSVGPHPDHLAAAAELHDTLLRATGCDIQTQPHCGGYRLILDQDAADRLLDLLLATDAKRAQPASRLDNASALRRRGQ
jgi:ParB family chromosome partitioning protein